jgi:hypothetical protein
MTANNKISKKRVPAATAAKKKELANARRRLSRSEKKREQALTKASAETPEAKGVISPARIAQFLSVHASSHAANKIAKILATTGPLIARLDAR